MTQRNREDNNPTVRPPSTVARLPLPPARRKHAPPKRTWQWYRARDLGYWDAWG